MLNIRDVDVAAGLRHAEHFEPRRAPALLKIGMACGWDGRTLDHPHAMVMVARTRVGGQQHRRHRGHAVEVGGLVLTEAIPQGDGVKTIKHHHRGAADE